MIFSTHIYLQKYLPLAFFIYGLAHFSMGLAVILAIRPKSKLKIVPILYWLAAFAIIHGISEWMDGVPLLAYKPSILFMIVRFALTLISVIILLVFGSELIVKQKPKRWLVFLPFYFIFAWLIIVSLFFSSSSASFFLNARIMIFYLLYLPGAILAGIGFLLTYSELKSQKYQKIAYNFLFIGILFFGLAFFEGLIVPGSFYFPASVFSEQHFLHIFAIPVELIRAVIAVLIAVFIVRSLRIFDAESARKLDYLEQKKRLMDVLQESLLRVKIPKIKDIDIAVHYESATEEAAIGGDFYDFFQLDENKFAFGVGDVSGHGIEVAADAFLTSHSVHCFFEHHNQPKDILRIVNNTLIKQLNMSSFVTMTLFVYDQKTNKVTYSSGGHPYPVFFSPPKAALLKVSGAALGNFKNEKYQQESFFFNSKDILVLYSDGLIEAKSNNSLYGEVRLKKVVEKNQKQRAQEIVDSIMADIRSFSKGKLTDDIVVLVVKKT